MPEGWLSRARIARAAGVTRATVKHYHDLGLLPPPVFTGPNMAYYDPASVERIALVRELRERRHLPLQTIAEMLATQGAERVAQALHLSRALRADLLDSLAGDHREPISRGEMLEIPGMDEEVLAKLEALGLVQALERDRYDPLSLKVAQAVGLMRAEGLTEQAGLRVEDLELYLSRLEALVRDEVALFTARVLGRFDRSTEERYMRSALKGADALVLAVRDRLLSRFLEEKGTPRRRR